MMENPNAKKEVAANAGTSTTTKDKIRAHHTPFLLKSQIHVVRGKPVIIGEKRYRWCLIPEELLK